MKEGPRCPLPQALLQRVLPFFFLNHICRLVSQGYRTCAITQPASVSACVCMIACLPISAPPPPPPNISTNTSANANYISNRDTILKNSKFPPFHGNVQQAEER